MNCRLKELKSKHRKPEALLKGKEYKVMEFVRERSQFLNKDGSSCFKLIAIYEDFKLIFHTFTPKKFDDMSVEDVDKLNEQIRDGENIRLVMYGKIGNANELDLLYNDDVVDKEKLIGIGMIEEAERASRGFSGTDDGLKRSSSLTNDGLKRSSSNDGLKRSSSSFEEGTSSKMIKIDCKIIKTDLEQGTDRKIIETDCKSIKTDSKQETDCTTVKTEGAN